jgi:hypothetical protein
MRLWPLLVGVLVAGCLPPAGFARPPTPTPSPLPPVDLCADYVRDTQRAVREISQLLAQQLDDLRAIAAQARPDETIARRLSTRRDDLLRSTTLFERAAPCPQGEAPRAPLAQAAGLVREASRRLNSALDSDAPAAYREAIVPYQQALEVLRSAQP